MKTGTWEYKILMCPYSIDSESALLWFKHKYDEEGLELVCPVFPFVSNGNTKFTDDYKYIFRKWVEYSTPLNMTSI